MELFLRKIEVCLIKTDSIKTKLPEKFPRLHIPDGDSVKSAYRPRSRGVKTPDSFLGSDNSPLIHEVHTERNLIKSNRNQIVFTMHRD